MKKFLLILPFLFILSHSESFAQYDPAKTLYLKKIKTFTRMQTAGFLMGGAGIAATVGGFTLLGSSDDGPGDFDIGKILFGLGGVIVGVPLTAGGTVLAILGTHNRVKYTNLLENINVGVRYDNSQKGLVLRYKF